MAYLKLLAFCGTVFAALPGSANAAPQVEIADPHAGHASVPAPASAAGDPHAHHHQATTAEPSALRSAIDPKLKALLADSTPRNGSVLAQSPPSISLTFPTIVTVSQIALTNAVGQRLPIAAALPTEPVSSFASPLIQLGRGRYTIVWRGTNDDGVMGGSLTFTVE